MRLRVASAVAGVVALGLLASAAAADPYAAFRAAHPEVGEEDLLDVERGDGLAKVLAVLHHPESGFDPRELVIVRGDVPGVEEVSLEDALAAEPDAATPLVVAVAQRCTGPSAAAPAFSSWFVVRPDGLRAWSLQAHAEDCSAEAELFQASDHGAMRLVGEKLFARVRRGPFRYGALRYETWDEAFASPRPESMLSRLQATARARPHDAHAQNRLAVGHYARGEREAALAALERATRLDPGWPTPHRNLAVAHRQAGDLAAAARETEQAERLSATSAVGSPPPL